MIIVIFICGSCSVVSVLLVLVVSFLSLLLVDRCLFFFLVFLVCLFLSCTRFTTLATTSLLFWPVVCLDSYYFWYVSLVNAFLFCFSVAAFMLFAFASLFVNVMFCIIIRRPLITTLFPFTTLFRSIFRPYC